MKTIKQIFKIIFCAALFFTGAGVGLCVNVFMERGVPITNVGGEVLLLLTIPSAVSVGYHIGNTRRRRRNVGTVKHPH